MLDRGLSWLAKQRHAHMTRTVTYARGSQQVELRATPARLRDDVRAIVSLDPVLVEAELVDWLISSSALAAFGQPQEGDQITDGDLVYEVRPIAPESAWRWSNNVRSTMRLHSRRVAG